MNRLDHTRYNLQLRRNRVRSTIHGTPERPRLSVTISNRHVSAQLIDDVNGKTLVTATTVAQEVAGSTSDRCAWVGKTLAQKAAKAKIKHVVFDRNGRQYQHRLRSLAEAARENGLEF